MRGYPLFSFRILIILAKIYFSPIVITFAKHTSVLGGTALKEAEIPKWGGGGGVLWISSNREVQMGT